MPEQNVRPDYHSDQTDRIEALFDLPFNDLLFQAQQVHRNHFNANRIQLSTLISVKTGGCEEDCKYCPQSSHHNTDVEGEALLPIQSVINAAKAAKSNGATRFCMGAAWREPKNRSLEPILEMIREVKSLGLETCATLGMLTDDQAGKLSAAGLDYYNHNLDTSPEYYREIISTRSYQERLDTLSRVRHAGINVCCGGIVGMGESRADRAALIAELVAMDPPPESVPVNMLIKVPGTPLENANDLDPFEFVRTIAVCRITLAAARVRLSAGREQMSDELQALCFLAGANSIFYGEKLLTENNQAQSDDERLFSRLGLTPETA